MRTDELRDLLQRFPDLERGELRRLRELYRDASATDVMTIMASPELAPKARRLEPPADAMWDRMLRLLLILLMAALVFYLSTQSAA